MVIPRSFGDLRAYLKCRSTPCPGGPAPAAAAISDLEDRTCRIVTHLDVDDGDVDALLEVMPPSSPERAGPAALSSAGGGKINIRVTFTLVN